VPSENYFKSFWLLLEQHATKQGLPVNTEILIGEAQNGKKFVTLFW